MTAIHTSDEVRTALRDGAAIVALETSVLAQGLPAPRNREAAERMTAAIRTRAAVPAWTATIDGEVVVGLADDEIDRLCTVREVAKVTRRDLPAACAVGTLGATTVSATVWAAYAAGVVVTATGGIGGVHPRTGDVSADLLELARIPTLLVCSGPKSIVDPVATTERLEELGVLLVGYRCDRLPFFLATETDIVLEHRVDAPGEAAAIAREVASLGVSSGVVLCNPVPAASALGAARVATAVAVCEERAAAAGVYGKDVTPFLLSCVAEQTEGASLETNLALLESNAALAAEVAVELAVGT